MAASESSKTKIQQMYVAYYGRPGDPAGVEYWGEVLDVAISTGGSIDTIVNAFGNSDEYLAGLGTGTTTEQVTALYQQMFGRDPETDGLDFWVNEIDSGSRTIGEVALAIAESAQNDDAITLANKVTAADYYTAQVTALAATYTASDIAAAKAIIATVTVDPVSVVNANASSDADIAPRADTDGKFLTLTTNGDSGADFTGGIKDDTYSGGVQIAADGVTLVDTLQNIDSLDGGAGTDTLNATLNGGTVVTPTLANIENVTLRVTNAVSALDLLASTGVTSVTVENSNVASTAATGTVNNVGAAALAVKNQKVDVSFNNSTATTLGLTLDSVGTVSTTAPVQTVVDLGKTVASKGASLNLTTNASNAQVMDTTGGSVATSVTIDATGANTIQLTNGVGSATSLAVTGTGSVDLSSASFTSALKTLTVADGGIKIVTTDTTAANLTATTGAGVDTLTVAGVNVNSLSSGAGKDVVTTTGDAALNTALTTAQATLTVSTTAAATAATDLTTSTAAAAAAQVTLDASTAAAATAATTLTASTATAATAATTLTASTATATAAKVVSDATAITLTNSVAAAGTTQTTLDASTNIATNTQTTLDASIAAAVVTQTTLDASIAAAITTQATLDAATAKDTALATMTAAIAASVAAADGGEQTENNTATATALAASAITNDEKNALDAAFATGLLTNIATAGTFSIATSDPIVATAAAATTAAGNADTAADALVVSDGILDTAADALVVSDGILDTAADAQVATDTIADNAADAQVVTDTTADTNAQATTDLADAIVVTDGTAKTAADAQVLTDTTAKTTADAQVVTDTAAKTTADAQVVTDTTAKATADAQVVTDTAAVTTAAAAAATAGALGAASTVDLGSEDDILTLSNGFASGATLNGGDGTDTLALTGVDYTAVAAYTTAKLALVTNFEALSITDALTTATFDVSKIAGVTSFTAANGVAAASAATVSNLAANSSVTLAGDLVTNTGSLTATLKTGSGADTLNLTLKPSYVDNNDTVVDAHARAETVTATGFETINLASTGLMTTITPVSGYKADLVTNTLTLNDDSLVTLNISGDQALNLSSTATQIALATIDASTNTGGLTFSGALANITTGVAMAITGSATAANNLTGSGLADTITGGAAVDTISGGDGIDTISAGDGKDVILGGAKADILTGGAGNDTFKLASTSDSILAARDVISDFTANTIGQGTGGVATTAGAVAVAPSTSTANGDVIDLSAIKGANTKIDIAVFTSAADAQTFLQNTDTANTANDTIGAALDSTTGFVYLDVNNDGTADSVIELTGVTTLDEAAFLL